MPRRRAVVQPFLPLADNRRDGVDRFKDDNNDDDDEYDAQTSDIGLSGYGEHSSRQFTLPQVTVSRPGSPYIKAGNADSGISASLSRTSSIVTAKSHLSRTSTFRPLLPRDKNQALVVSPPRKAPRLEKESTLEGSPRQAFSRKSTALVRNEDVHPYRGAQDTSSLAAQSRIKPIRAVRTTGTAATPSRAGSDRDEEEAGPSVPIDTSKSAREPVSKPTSGPTQLRKSPRNSTRKDAFSEEPPSSIPSRRTPSINELQGESIDTFALNTRGTVKLRRGGTKLDINAGALKTRAAKSRTKRSPKSDIEPSAQTRAGSASNEEDAEAEKGHQTRLRRSGRPKSAASTRPSPTKPRRSKRNAELSSSSDYEEESKSVTREDAESPITAAELVTLLPKRKGRVRKAVQGKDPIRADNSMDDSIDESRQYDRENWDSSASSSDEMESDETDYDEVEAAPKVSKKPSSKEIKSAAPSSRSKSVKPGSSKSPSSKAKSNKVIDISDGESQNISAKYEPGKEKRKAYFAEVDEFEMDVELVV
ncbi:hypothetical protein P389DRAFT_172879 [Cystobasidium minutum MCA 4210]|uniref:uncharacterized protein n=1 Tax=Cystobasidium minutum MCA 4210 TaxID=1397322 RepID=UPI0034CEE234|eukprot:jgi/Rhomi1/172879/fgenesh1_kg.5_\